MSALKKELGLHEAAYTELGYLEEDRGNIIEASKWFLVCEFLCETDERQHATDALAKWRHDMRGADLDEASELAREWIKNRSLIVEKPATDSKDKTQKNESLAFKGDVFAVLFGAEIMTTGINLAHRLMTFTILRILNDNFGAVDYVESNTFWYYKKVKRINSFVKARRP